MQEIDTSYGVFRKIHRKTPVPDLTPATLLKKRLWHWCFPVNLANFKENLFTENLWVTASQKNIF